MEQINEFKCEVCKGVFEKELTDKQVKEQLKNEFPGFAPADCGIVCNNCFKKMFK